MRLAYTETVLNFDCHKEHLLGIVATPDEQLSRSDIGVIIVVGGPQYRVGSHRLFVLLARALAEAGVTALRFDYRGMGDSGGSARDFLAVTPDIKAAIDALLHAHSNLKRIVLWGLCDGASASLLYCDETQDSRVCGLVLLNPWVRSAESLARAHVKYYYWQRIRQAEFWRKILSGRVALSAVRGFSKSIKAVAFSAARNQNADLTFQDRMARSWADKSDQIFLILSGRDYTAKEFSEVSKTSKSWQVANITAKIKSFEVPFADHTFSDSIERAKIEVSTINWVSSIVENNRAEVNHA